MTNRNERGAAAHDRHDTFLVAAHAAGDLDGAANAVAEAQIAGCTACAALDADLRAIATATRELAAWPLAAAAAHRDFRLTPEQAARLKPRSGWRRLLRPFSDGSAWVRPLAGALTTLGLAGLLLTAVLPGFAGMLGGTASAPVLSAAGSSVGGPAPAQAPGTQPEAGAAGGGGAPAASAAATAGPAAVDANGSVSSPQRDLNPTLGLNAAASPGDKFSTSGTPPNRLSEQSGPAPTLDLTTVLTLGSLVVLLVGLGLFALRRLARRLA